MTTLHIVISQSETVNSFKTIIIHVIARCCTTHVCLICLLFGNILTGRLSNRPITLPMMHMSYSIIIWILSIFEGTGVRVCHAVCTALRTVFSCGSYLALWFEVQGNMSYTFREMWYNDILKLTKTLFDVSTSRPSSKGIVC